MTAIPWVITLCELKNNSGPEHDVNAVVVRLGRKRQKTSKYLPCNISC